METTQDLINEAMEISTLNIADETVMQKRIRRGLGNAARELEQLRARIQHELNWLRTRLHDADICIAGGDCVNSCGVVQGQGLTIDQLCAQQPAAVAKVEMLLEIVTNTDGQ